MKKTNEDNKNKNKVSKIIVFITALVAMLVTTCGVAIAIFMPYIVMYYAPIWILSQIYLCFIVWCIISEMLPTNDKKKDNKVNNDKSKIRAL